MNSPSDASTVQAVLRGRTDILSPRMSWFMAIKPDIIKEII